MPRFSSKISGFISYEILRAAQAINPLLSKQIRLSRTYLPNTLVIFKKPWILPALRAGKIKAF